jgi:hypothetical protein
VYIRRGDLVVSEDPRGFGDSDVMCYKNVRLVSCGVERTLSQSKSLLTDNQMHGIQTKKLLSWFTETALNFQFKILTNFGEHFVVNDSNILKSVIKFL